MPRYVVAESPAPLPPVMPAMPTAPAAGESEHLPEIDLQYTGSGRLTVTGPVTGTVYYFSANGNDTLSVHGADAPALMAVPGLKVVS